MRPRKKTNLVPRLEACGAVLLQDAAEHKGELRTQFADPSAPLHLELGCGKGGFAVEMAQRNPGINFIAMEKEPNVAVIAAERMRDADPPVPNLRLLLDDAERLPQMFVPGELSRIYINFCDPWHKHRQYRRRLTFRDRLRVYRGLLMPGGELWFKTDNYNLYHFSLFEFAAAMPAYFETDNLHASVGAAENVVTEYERYFTDLGQTIYAIRARRDEGEDGKHEDSGD